MALIWPALRCRRRLAGWKGFLPRPVGFLLILLIGYLVANGDNGDPRNRGLHDLDQLRIATDIVVITYAALMGAVALCAGPRLWSRRS